MLFWSGINIGVQSLKKTSGVAKVCKFYLDYIELDTIKKNLQGTQNYATSISIIFELDAIEKLTFGYTKVCTLYFHFL